MRVGTGSWFEREVLRSFGSGLRVRPLEVVPPFLLGMGTAVSAEMALGLLLYSAEGFFPALTLILMIELAALTAGVATRPASPDTSRTWRWMIAAGSLFIAGTAALFWSVARDVPGGAAPRGIVLAVFAALPMYGFGLVLSGLRTHLRGADGRRWPGRPRPIGGAILLGATLGVLIFGQVLLPRFTPLSVYMFSLLCVASSAMLEGSRHERARHAYLAIPSITEFAPDEGVEATPAGSPPQPAGSAERA